MKKKPSNTKKKKTKPLTDSEVSSFFDDLVAHHEAEKIDKEILDVSEDEYKKLRAADKKKRQKAVPVNVKKQVEKAVDNVEPKIAKQKIKVKQALNETGIKPPETQTITDFGVQVPKTTEQETSRIYYIDVGNSYSIEETNKYLNEIRNTVKSGYSGEGLYPPDKVKIEEVNIKRPKLRPKIIHDGLGNLEYCIGNRKTVISKNDALNKYTVSFRYWKFFFWKSWYTYPEFFDTEKDALDFITSCINKHNPLHNVQWPRR